jgi:hypothetical protein
VGVKNGKEEFWNDLKDYFWESNMVLEFLKVEIPIYKFQIPENTNPVFTRQ